MAGTSSEVFFSALVIRADSSPPEGARRAEPGYAVNAAGRSVEVAGEPDTVLALTDRPQLEWEAYQDYWRKTHGPKVLHRDGPDDDRTELCLLYQQYHRLPSGPTSEQPPPYPARLGEDGRIVTDPAARREPYRRPEWDAYSTLAFAGLDDAVAFFDMAPGLKYPEKLLPDQQIFNRGFLFHLARERVVVAGARAGRDAIAVVRPHVRAPGLGRGDFEERWARHGELVAGLPATGPRPSRYVQMLNVSEPGDPFYVESAERYDGIGLMFFEDVTACEEFLGADAGGEVAADESSFASTAWFTTLNHVVADAR